MCIYVLVCIYVCMFAHADLYQVQKTMCKLTNAYMHYGSSINAQCYTVYRHMHASFAALAISQSVCASLAKHEATGSLA